MYEAFYGLRERPFNLTPDPKYLYLSDKHKEAFAHLLYGIQNRSGFVMVTGEIGTGKTTICRNLINQLDQKIDLALIFNPALEPIELIQKICDEFGIESDGDNVRVLVDRLNEFLLSTFSAGRSAVLIIDEAQNLSPAVLEQIRLLSNLETETEKLLQIILIGQPELGEKLALYELRQLNQRITARYHLEELSEKETLQYINYRLHVAGGRRKVRFSKGAVQHIYKVSKGTPRVINALCDRCLLVGYTKEMLTISPQVAKQAAKELKGHQKAGSPLAMRSVGKWLPSPNVLVGAALLIVVFAAAGFFFGGPVQRLANELSDFNRILAGGETEGAARPDGSAKAEEPGGAVVEAKVSLPAPESPALKKVVETIQENNAPPEPEPMPTLAEMLAELEPVNTLQAASAAMLAAWDATLEGDYPSEPSAEALIDFAQRHGLAYERLKPALGQLLAIDLPALVKVKAGEGELWSSLIKKEDLTLTMTGALGETIEATREEFGDVFASEAIVFWEDPTPGAGALIPGRRSPSVVRLKEQLRGLGRIQASNTSNEYDRETATAVSRIQSETALLQDGMAGKQVRMVLTSWLGSYDTPSLSGGTAMPVGDEALSTAAVMLRKPERPAAKPAPKKPMPIAAALPAPVESTPAPAVEAPPVEEDAPAEEVPAEEEEPTTPSEPEAVATVVSSEPSEPEVSIEPAETSPPVEEVPEESAEAPEDSEETTEVPEGDVSNEAPAAEPETGSESGEIVRVEELPEPGAEEEFESDDRDTRKEITPPLAGSSPLVPAEG